MYYILSVFIGFVISIMVTLNGELTSTYGVFLATVIIHICAILVLLVVLLINRQSIKIKKKIPLYYFIGGLLGVLTTVFNNYAFPFLGVSLLLSLCLLGQSATSLVLDMFHIFNHNQKTNNKTIFGLILLILGNIVMIRF